jgi:uncharacterized protein
MRTEIIKIKKPAETNVIVGQAHFIKTIEDIHEALVNSVPGIKFGAAFCEASGPCLVRSTGTDDSLKKPAAENALNIGAGHMFIIILKNAYPINVLKAVKDVPEVCSIYCATSNDVELIIAETEQGRGIIGVIDGSVSRGIENEEDVRERKELLRKIGYKL